jgi:hypothetical protein
MFYYVRFSFESKEDGGIRGIFLILLTFFRSQHTAAHMAVEILFVTDGMEVTVFRQVEGKSRVES